MIDKLKELATHPAIEAITALILILVGLNHIMDPTGSMIASWIGGLPSIVYQFVGALVLGNAGIKAVGILNK